MQFDQFLLFSFQVKPNFVTINAFFFILLDNLILLTGDLFGIVEEQE